MRLKHTLVIALATFALLFVAAASQSRAAIGLKNAVVVEGPVVLLSDLFTGLSLHKAQTPIARSPQPGQQVLLNAKWLAALARAQRLEWRPSSGFEQVTLARASQTLDPALVEKVLIDALFERGLPDNAEFSFDSSLPRPRISVGSAPSLRVANLTYDKRSGRFSAEIVAPANGEPQFKAQVLGSAHAMVDVPLPNRRIGTKEIIGINDIEWERRRADRLARNTITDIDALLGKSPRRPLRAGRVVREGDLTQPLLITKNSLVTLRLVTKVMTLTATGRALEDGSLGEAIRVQNTHSNKVVTAIVKSPDWVEVVGPGLAAAK